MWCQKWSKEIHDTQSAHISQKQYIDIDIDIFLFSISKFTHN